MIGERLKRARAAAGLSMQTLGQQQVGVSANMIKKYEHDDSMPSSGVLIRLAKALALKHEYGLSMQSCLYRAADLGIISQAVREHLFVQFSKQGWRTQEPGKPYPSETTLLFQQLVYRALGEGIIGESKAAELLSIPVIQFHQTRKLESLDAPTS